MKRQAWLKDAVATTKGWVSKSGEVLVSGRMTQEEVDTHNGVVVVAAPVVIETAPVEAVEEVIETAPVEETTFKKKAKKSFFKSSKK